MGELRVTITDAARWGRITLMGDDKQRATETYWRRKVSGLRQNIEASDVESALSIGLGRYDGFEQKDRRLIEAALDGVDQATIADFIYLLMWCIQGEA